MPTYVDMGTKITANSESPTPVSYRWSIVTFSLSRTVFELFEMFVIMWFPISAPPKLGFLPLKSRINCTVSTRPPKGTSLLGKHMFWNTRCGSLDSHVTVRVAKKVGKN